MTLPILPVKSKAKITSALGGAGGIYTVFVTVLHSPGSIFNCTISGEIVAEVFIVITDKTIKKTEIQRNK